MAAVSTVLIGVGLGLSAAGTAINYSAQKKRAAAEEKAENAREKAMNLDALRRKRAVIREAQIARSTALANATAQGAAEGSGLQGGYGGITGQEGSNISGIEQNRQLGAEVFQANRAASRASTMSSFGQSVQSIGGMLIEQRGAISRVGASLFG